MAIGNWLITKTVAKPKTQSYTILDGRKTVSTSSSGYRQALQNALSGNSVQNTAKVALSNQKEILKGDANDDGVVDKKDLELLMRYEIGLTKNINFQASDLNGDGEVDLIDRCKLSIMLQEEKPQVTKLKGDVNGDGKVDVVNDAVTIMNYVNGIIGKNDFDYDNADVNGDGKVDMKDANAILNGFDPPEPIITIIDPPFTSGRAIVATEAYADFNLNTKVNANEKIFANEVVKVTGMSSDGKALRVEYSSIYGGVKERWVNRSDIEEYTEPSVPQKLQDLMNTWNGRTWKDHYYLKNVKQCKEFASYIFYQLYGVSYPGSGSTSSNYYNWRLNNVPSSVYQVGEVSQGVGLTAANAKALFSNAQSGDFIQMKRGHGGAHSAILTRKNDQGVWFFEANADGKNTIQEKFYSWDDLVKITNKGVHYNVAMSIYRAK